MLMNSLWNSNAQTDEEYKVVLKGRLNLYYFLGLLGIITAIVAWIYTKNYSGHQENFMSGFYFGIAGALIIASVLRIVSTKRILASAVKVRESRLKVQDERTKMISQKALATTGLIVIIISYIGMLIMGLINMAVFWTFWAIAMGFIIIYVFVRKYYDSKY